MPGRGLRRCYAIDEPRDREQVAGDPIRASRRDSNRK
ncbi:MAG: hypothetical protein QOG59_3707, partial [Solirubrobacteraceae bacterium]|nr:hypothetical protein [Solirubrobacteraceae bacterium]